MAEKNLRFRGVEKMDKENKTMKAFVLLGKDKVGWRDVPRTEPGPFDAIIKPTVVAPCSTDVHHVRTDFMPNIRNKAMGHEAVGRIVEVGSEVKDFKVGDRVAIPSVQPIMRSMEAQNGMAKIADSCHYYNLDPNSPRGGCFAEFSHILDADMNLAHIPESVTYEQAVMLTDMATTGFAGVEAANVNFGDTVVIYGIGPVGLMAINAAVLRGASRIFAVGHRKICFEVAKQYGATDLIDYVDGDVAKQVFRKTNRRPVDAVIVNGGSSGSIGIALKMVRPGGIVANVAFFEDDTTVLPNQYWSWGCIDKTIKGVKAWGGRNAMERLLSLVEHGRIKPELLITQRFYGLEKCEDAMTLMASKTDDIIKPIVIIE